MFSGCSILGNDGDTGYTPKEVWDNRESLVGKQIVVSGKAGLYQVACTQMACECCNSCGGGVGLEIDDENVLLVVGNEAVENQGLFGYLYDGKEVGCGGGECDISCYPFEKGKRYRVVGTLRVKEYKISRDEYYLELEAFEEL
ncbi:hypothetical protein HQ544_02295 [Candidatus Falkowbacteria bacterium]|nr:hypothetical protein [Candidatus Falkowbacteria bacterium]